MIVREIIVFIINILANVECYTRVFVEVPVLLLAYNIFTTIKDFCQAVIMNQLAPQLGITALALVSVFR